jgi:Domain of unknown function (DUF4192)
MNPQPQRPTLRIDSVAGLLAAIPHLLGFTPRDSLVVLGAQPPRGRVQIAFRYDLPDPPDAGTAAGIAGHAAGVLASHHLTTAIAAGYGPGRLVTPVADALRQVLPGTGVRLRDVLRVEDGRYWSYLCPNPSCCPPDGTPFDPAGHPAAAVLAQAGLSPAPSREAVAATIAALTGPEAEAMASATRQAERIAARLTITRGPDGLDQPGIAAIRAAIGVYRDGGVITAPVRHAWLALVLRRLRIRDDAWARMDPTHRDAHRRLWTDLVRRAQPGYLAAPASLLAFTAWQGGDGALANIALDQALADTPGYSMALLLREALTAGAPPSMATPPMTPEQVADSYATPSASSGEQPGPTAPGTGT